MPDIYYLYRIECIPTGKVYVGLTGGPNPCWRWSRHMTDLQQGVHINDSFQKAWKEYPEWKCWRFNVVDAAEGRRAASHKEAEIFLSIPQEKRLNAPNTATVSLGRRKLVELMLDEKRRYVDIRDAVGVSIGTISNIKRSRGCFSILSVSPSRTTPYSTEKIV